jgi:hypothetical protein
MTPLEQAFADGRLAERDRIAAILASVLPEQLATAISLALASPNMTSEDVVAFIAALPEATPARSSIAARMREFNQAIFSLGHAPPRGGSEWDSTINKQSGNKL